MVAVSRRFGRSTDYTIGVALSPSWLLHPSGGSFVSSDGSNRGIAIRYIAALRSATTPCVTRIAYSKDALRTLSRMPVNVSALIRAKVAQYAADPASLANNVKALRGEPGVFRLRVGDWRIVFAETGEVLAIIRVAPRGGAYD